MTRTRGGPSSRMRLGGQMDPGIFAIYTMRAGQPDLLVAFVNAVSATEEYWLTTQDFVQPSSTNTLVRWKVVYLGAAIAPGCAALRDWACTNYPDRTTGPMAGLSFEITDEGDYTCP